MSYERARILPCVICKESVKLDESKTDEYGGRSTKIATSRPSH
jgi:hypothetical protein